MEIRVHILGLVMMSLCVFVPDAQGNIQVENKTTTACFGEDLSPACHSKFEIAIASYHDGFKNVSLQCPLDGTAKGDCCKYDKNTDCLQEAPTEARYVDTFSGKDSGAISTSSVSANGSCSSSSYSAVSVFSEIKYLCIPESSTISMCSSNVTTGDAVFIQNRDYPASSILNTDTHCNCSIEVDEFEPIHLYIIHLDLFDTPGNCQQNLTLYDGQGRVLKAFMCEDHPYNTIVNETLSTTYITLEMNNRYNVTNGGKFWLGFQGENGPIALRCPAEEQMKFAGCSNLTNPEDGTVNVTSLSYMANATYTCNSGFTAVGGDPQRTCLSNNTWSGEPLVCQTVEKNETKCAILEDPSNGRVISQNVSVGSSITYTCNPGYTTDPNTLTRYCQENSTWSGQEPVCRPVVCMNLTNPKDGTVNVTSLSYMGVATYTCNSGFTAVGGDPQRTCLKNNTWSGDPLVCQAVEKNETKCDRLLDPPNGLVKVQNLSVGSQATYVCNEGYEAPPETLTRVCLDTGTWDRKVPECAKKGTDGGQPVNVTAIVVSIVVVVAIVSVGFIVYILYRKGKCDSYSLVKFLRKRRYMNSDQELNNKTQSPAYDNVTESEEKIG